MEKTERISSSQFERVFRELHTQLFYLAYDIVGDKIIAQDIVSDVFLSVWNQHRDISMVKMKGYLFISVKNKAIDKCRQEQKWKMIPADELKSLTQGDCDWEAREDRIIRVEHELEQMPVKTQTILDLCYRKNKTYKETADMLGMSVEAVKKQLSRALKVLRNKLNDKKK